MVGLPLAQGVSGARRGFHALLRGAPADRDATNGFRLFSRRAIDTIEVESDSGFCYSLEMLVKSHRLGWTVADVPAQWFERRRAPAASRC